MITFSKETFADRLIMKTTLGIIEGFYGRLYEKEQRDELMSFISDKGYSYYIYAPKSDKSLRREWQKPFDSAKTELLVHMSEMCTKLNLDFGVGISPLQITKEKDRLLNVLIDKIDWLLENTNTKIIAILFDDISLYTNEEGKKQNEIIKEVHSYLTKKNSTVRLIFCPTYYTFDPILDKVFGQRPVHYYEDIVKDLDKSIEIFWTGNRVLSKAITKDDIEKANTLWGRKVTLWDNYPVNDGKFISKHIYTRPFKNRSDLDGIVLSHAVNPMLECKLNEVALESLLSCYKGLDEDTIEKDRICRLKKLLPESYEKISDILDILNDEGIEALSDNMIDRLKKEISKDKTKASQEIIDFLNGVYKFDEACLTD